jgi:hypothetical protein
MEARMGPLNCDGGATGPKRMHGFRLETASSLDTVPILREPFSKELFLGGYFWYPQSITIE